MKPDQPVEVERAFDFTITETRSDDGLTLEGYAAVFNSPTTIDSWEGKFTEVIAPGAFKRSINSRMPIMQFDHGNHPMIGGLPIGVIRSLKEDARGLKVEARLSNNWLIQPIRDAIADGAVSGMSFRFTPLDEEWDGDIRTIKEVKLHEVGPVVFPAYRDTTVGVRSSSDAVSQLVDLIRSDESLRAPLAAALTFGTPTEPADTGTSDGPADGNEQAPEPEVEEQPTRDEARRAELLELADFMERAALNRERSRLI